MQICTNMWLQIGNWNFWNSKDELRKLCKQYHDTIAKLESDKYDLEYQVKKIDFEIHELSVKVNDMRGKL